ncbi:MAG: helix-turn-helix domain-containing protein [Acidimicrobiales bacterium]
MVDTLSAATWSDTPRTKTTRLVATERAAEYLGVSARTVKQLMSEGRLPYVKIGRSTRVDLADLDRFIAQNRRKQRHPPRRRVS